MSGFHLPAVHTHPPPPLHPLQRQVTFLEHEWPEMHMVLQVWSYQQSLQWCSCVPIPFGDALTGN